MKRSVLLISAFAVFGLLFTQCKKNQEVLPVIPSGEKIDVTLNVPNNGGGKTSISDNGTIVWTSKFCPSPTMLTPMWLLLQVR